MGIGQKLWEETSRAVGRRICDVSEQGVHEEISFVGQLTGFGRWHGTTGRIVGTDNYRMKIKEENVIEGSAQGVLYWGEEIVGFKAMGCGKTVRRSPLGKEALVSLIWFPDPPPNLGWMKTTVLIWEAVVDPENQTITATAHEWAEAGAVAPAG